MNSLHILFFRKPYLAFCAESTSYKYLTSYFTHGDRFKFYLKLWIGLFDNFYRFIKIISNKLEPLLEECILFRIVKIFPYFRETDSERLTVLFFNYSFFFSLNVIPK